MVGSVVASTTAAFRRSIFAVGDFVSSGAFGILVLSITFCWTLAMVAMIYWPQTFTPIAAFAASFRIWCFGYDPLTGKFDMARLALVVLDPIFFTLLIGTIWKRPMQDTVRASKKPLYISLALASALVLGILIFVSKSDATPEIAGKKLADFRLERTYEAAPKFELTDQTGAAFNIKPGHITIVSAFYTHCAHTCPKIIEQGRHALAKAKVNLDKIDLALITLDPENDDVESLRDKAQSLKLTQNWHLLTGPAKKVNDILDQYQVVRVKDEYGNIGHSNIFYVIDSKGRIAFKIGLGSAQEVWLKQVIELLEQES